MPLTKKKIFMFIIVALLGLAILTLNILFLKSISGIGSLPPCHIF